MKEVKFSVYEVSMLKRYLMEYLKLKEKADKKKNRVGSNKFTNIEYDKKQIKTLMERLDGKDYVEVISLESRNYSKDMYVGKGFSEGGEE